MNSFYMLFLLLFTWEVSSTKKKTQDNTNNSTNFSKHNTTHLCSNPNTKISKNGTCECINSDFYGDPNSSEGCWTCIPKCHPNGICIKENKCECKKNYFGDGIDSCKMPIPNISFYSSDKCNSENTEIYFSIQKVKYFKPDEVLCRFGTFISYGEVLNRSFIKCDCPSLRNGIFKTSLSFDNEIWSPQIKVEFYQESSSVFSLYTYLILALLITSFISAIAWYNRLSFDSRNDTTEVLPLNKWHMHQIQQEVGEENRIIDFISHIITN